MKEEKNVMIGTLKDWVKSSPYLIVLDYTGMKVSEFSELRGRLRKVGAAGVRGDCSAWSTRPIVATVSDSTSTRKAERVFFITNSFLSNGAGTRVP